MNMTKEEESHYAKAVYEAAVYKEQLKLLEREIQRIQLTSVDLNTAAQTCKKLKSEEGLVPIGGGTYINATIKSTKALVPVGANYLVELECSKAELELHKRVDAAKKASEKLRNEYKKIAEKLQALSTQLRSLKAKLAISRRVDENIGEDYI